MKTDTTMSKIDNLFYILLPLLVLGIPFHYSVFSLCVVLLLLRCVTSERTTVAAFLMIYAGPTIGCIRAVDPSLPLYGVLFCILGFLMVVNYFRNIFQNNVSGIASLCLVFLYFFIVLINGGNSEYGQEKYAGIISNGISSLVGFYILFTSRTVNNEQFAQMLIITSIIMIEYLVALFGFQSGGVFDYNWVREAVSLLEKTAGGNIIGYQHIGMNTAFAYGIFMSSKKLDIKRLLFYSIICFQLALTSGARQAMLATLVVLILRLVVIGYSGVSKTNLKNSVIAVLSLFIVYEVVSSLDIDIVTKTLESGDAGRDELREQALAIFDKNPLFGSGLGGFYKMTGENYPHNFFLEVLCECGIFGLLFLSLVYIVFMVKHKIGIGQLTRNDSFFLIIMISLFVRCMVSGNFTISIQLFSALFALAALPKDRINKFNSGNVHVKI